MATIFEVVTAWEQQRWPITLMRCEHNYTTLKMAVDEFTVRSGGNLNFDNLDGIVRSLGDVQKGGRLVWIPVAAANVMPHSDLKELDNVRNLADLKRLRSNPKELEKYQRLRPTDTPYQSLNERMKWIIDNKIEGPVEAPAVELTPKQQADKDAYAAARQLVASLSYRDVGKVGSTPSTSAWAQIGRFKEQHERYINECEKRGVSGAFVLKQVNDDIAALRSSSVR